MTTRIFLLLRLNGPLLLVSLLLIGCESLGFSSATEQVVEESRLLFPEEELSYKGRRLVLTKHARCRMDCRKIDAYEVQEVIDKNQVNLRKSKPAENGRCKSIAYEGDTRDGQRARIIVGDCADDPIVITVIDLDTKHNCVCK